VRLFRAAASVPSNTLPLPENVLLEILIIVGAPHCLLSDAPESPAPKRCN
jgi:hypothetical protein